MHHNCGVAQPLTGGGYEAVAVVPPVDGVRDGGGLDSGAADLDDAALAVVEDPVEVTWGFVWGDEVPDFVAGPDGAGRQDFDSESVFGLRRAKPARPRSVRFRCTGSGCSGAAPLSWRAIRRYAASSSPSLGG